MKLKFTCIVVGMLLLSGCLEQPKTHTQKQVESEIAQRTIDMRTMNGDFAIHTPPVVCVYGVLYLYTRSYGSRNHYTPLIDAQTLTPRRCKE